VVLSGLAGVQHPHAGRPHFVAPDLEPGRMALLRQPPRRQTELGIAADLLFPRTSGAGVQEVVYEDGVVVEVLEKTGQ
jgi:hypothetical protein